MCDVWHGELYIDLNIKIDRQSIEQVPIIFLLN